jgi:hypothetical protein
MTNKERRLTPAGKKLAEKYARMEYTWAHPFESKETLDKWWANTKKKSPQDLVSYYWKARELILSEPDLVMVDNEALSVYPMTIDMIKADKLVLYLVEKE